MAVSEHAWFNGTIVATAKADPSIASNTLHLGISVFEGIMAYWNRDHWYIHRRDEHLRRFVGGAGRMDLVTPWGVDDLSAGIDELLETLPKRTHYLRPIAYRTAAEVFFQVAEDSSSICVFAVPVGRDAEGGQSLQLSARQRVHHRAIPATWKVSGAYANSYLAEREARADGFDTALMLDVHGRIAEASTSNILFLSHGELVTPRLDGDVFPGITRALLLELAAGCGLTVAERDVRPAELAGFEAALISGTLSEVRPVDRIGDHVYDSAAHPGARRLLDAFRSETHQ
jgi:branched-chain amino acid aminotransferase